jgi:hypothetical protein
MTLAFGAYSNGGRKATLGLIEGLLLILADPLYIMSKSFGPFL